MKNNMYIELNFKSISYVSFDGVTKKSLVKIIIIIDWKEFWLEILY